MSEIGDSAQEALLRVPVENALLPRREKERVKLRIGIQVTCYPSSREAIRAALERELLAFGKFGVELDIIVDQFGEGDVLPAPRSAP